MNRLCGWVFGMGAAMNADSGPDPGGNRPDVLAPLRPSALVVIALVCGCSVWAFHYGDVFLICAAIILGGSLGLFVSLVAGVSIPDTMLTIGAITGLFEGIVRGFSYYGLVGAIVGGLLGLVAGMIASVPVMVLILMILCLGTGSVKKAKSE